MTDHDADDEELAEAQALARSLEGSARDGEPPADALQVAALLRFSGKQGELSDERAASILSELDSVPLPPGVPRRRWLRAWLPLGLGLGMAAAAALMITLSREEPAGAVHVHVQVPQPSTLPPAGVELLSAQAALARQDQEEQHFEAQMKAYRQRMFRSLEAHYPLALSALVVDSRASR